MTELFGITLVTYYREDNSTLEKITRAINSILHQSYQNFKIFLVGDNYTNKEEFQNIIKLIPIDKCVSINLEKGAGGKERQLFQDGLITRTQLWKSGGGKAMFFALKLCRIYGIKYRCHLDDDDYWNPNHLETFINTLKIFPQAVFLFTQSIYLGYLLPFNNIKLNYNNMGVRDSSFVHSSICMNIQKIPCEYKYITDDDTKTFNFPCDADLWNRIGKYCITNNLKTIYIPYLTCHHDTEGAVLK